MTPSRGVPEAGSGEPARRAPPGRPAPPASGRRALQASAEEPSPLPPRGPPEKLGRILAHAGRCRFNPGRRRQAEVKRGRRSCGSRDARRAHGAPAPSLRALVGGGRASGPLRAARRRSPAVSLRGGLVPPFHGWEAELGVGLLGAPTGAQPPGSRVRAPGPRAQLGGLQRSSVPTPPGSSDAKKGGHSAPAGHSGTHAVGGSARGPRARDSRPGRGCRSGT